MMKSVTRCNLVNKASLYDFRDAQRNRIEGNYTVWERACGK